LQLIEKGIGMSIETKGTIASKKYPETKSGKQSQKTNCSREKAGKIQKVWLRGFLQNHQSIIMVLRLCLRVELLAG
jgi:hypothetical protein